MKILVANLGSTSFKYRLFDMADERQLARGGDRADRLAGEPLRRSRSAARARRRCSACPTTPRPCASAWPS